jgi:uncharacterized protein YbaR (Trm112 family)
MTLPPDFVAILACPVDHEPLLYLEAEDVLYNPRLKRKYRIEDDIPVLLIEEAEIVDESEHVRLLALHARPNASNSDGPSTDESDVTSSDSINPARDGQGEDH